MKSLIILAFVLLPLCAHAEDAAALPPAADLVIKNYEREVAAARDRAVKQLQSIMASETQRAKLDSAVAVKNAIASLSGGGAVDNATPGVPPKTGKISIKANARLGAELGSFTAGTTLKLEYVEGKWAMSGGMDLDPTKWVNPDDPAVYPANHIGVFAIENGEAKKLAEVPGGTKRKPFRYRFAKNYSTVILRILDSDPVDNPGFVIYNVEVNK